METVQVLFTDGRREECPEGASVAAMLPAIASPQGLPYLAALVNNDAVSLSYPLTVNSEVRFLTMADSHGWRIYRRSLCFVLAKAVQDLYPQAQFSVGHSFGVGLYCSFLANHDRRQGITPDILAAINEHMRDLVSRRLPIVRRKIAFTDAVKHFEKTGQQDKLNLLKYRNPPRVVIHWCDGFTDLAHGPLVPNTGVLERFQLIHYPPGFVLNLPERENPLQLAAFEDQPQLFQIIKEHKEWGRILGVTRVGDLNAIIANRQIDEFIQTAEALHEKKLARIADQIASAPTRIRLVLIAGPSSSGKTTFAKRLSSHLRVNGLRPVTISTDNYFVGDALNPLLPDGTPDYEHLEAVDLPLLNQHLALLVNGREAETPLYNFVARKRDGRYLKLRIDDDQVIIIEGIHGLNPRLTEGVPSACKFKIYVSALTQLNVDANNRISTTDNRLMRRIVRDHKFRGHSALETLRLWPSVRNGEKTWIFPFQKEADATFNSALDYELAVLKPTVEALLMEVKPSHAEYAEARRLSEFLLNFLATSDRPVPGTSILREYIGGSSFRY